MSAFLFSPPAAPQNAEPGAGVVPVQQIDPSVHAMYLVEVNAIVKRQAFDSVEAFKHSVLYGGSFVMPDAEKGMRAFNVLVSRTEDLYTEAELESVEKDLAWEYLAKEGRRRAPRMPAGMPDDPTGKEFYFPGIRAHLEAVLMSAPDWEATKQLFARMQKFYFGSLPGDGSLADVTDLSGRRGVDGDGYLGTVMKHAAIKCYALGVHNPGAVCPAFRPTELENACTAENSGSGGEWSLTLTTYSDQLPVDARSQRRALKEFQKKFPIPKGYYVLEGHGCSVGKGIQVKVDSKSEPEVCIAADLLHRWLHEQLGPFRSETGEIVRPADRSNYESNKPIVFWSCGAAYGDNSIAQELSRLEHTNVVAPTGDIWVPGGEYWGILPGVPSGDVVTTLENILERKLSVANAKEVGWRRFCNGRDMGMVNWPAE